MKTWTVLEQVTTPDGSELALVTDECDYVIRVNGRELMSTRHFFSEEQLAVVACAELKKKKGVRVIIGGLGLGFTLRAALASLGADAEVVVAELLPEIVSWNQNPSYKLASAALADPRTHVVIGDVAPLIARSRNTFDAIMLDADNETTAMNTAGNSSLYQAHGLARVHAALLPGGRVVYWSAGEDPLFAKRLGKSGFDVELTIEPKPAAMAGRISAPPEAASASA